MKYMIIRGPAGVGKTTIAEMVAERLKMRKVSVDDVLKEMGLDKIEGECIPEENFLRVNETIDVDVDMVVEGNFYHRRQLEDLIEKMPGVQVFTLKASLETCLERDKTRHNLGSAGIKDVYKLASRFDYGTVIDTEGKTEEEVVAEILSRDFIMFK